MMRVYKLRPDLVPDFVFYARKSVIDLRNLPAITTEERQDLDAIVLVLARIETAHRPSKSTAVAAGQQDFAEIFCTRCVRKFVFSEPKSRDELQREGWRLHPSNPRFLSTCPRHSLEALHADR